MEYKVNDYKVAKDWLKNTDAILITASNGLSIAEGYHIFADNGSFRRYFGKFRQKYGTDCLIRGVFTPMTAADHEEYMQTVHQYLIDDYNLTYYAAFAGCSAETDASFETITFLAGKLDELNLPAVLTIENSDQKVAKAVIENTNTKDQKILTLNSMQSVTTKDVEEGTTYLSIMENNLQILKEAL